MKKFLFFSFFLLFNSLLQVLLSQENEIASFREFIELLERKEKDKTVEISDSAFLFYLDDAPYQYDESEKTISFFMKRDEFTGILSCFTSEMGKSEETKLVIYNWEGDFITQIDFGSVSTGDYFSDVTLCQLQHGDTIQCKNTVNEGGLEEVKVEDGNITGMNYVTKKEEISYEYFRILPDGNIEAIETEEEN